MFSASDINYDCNESVNCGEIIDYKLPLVFLL